MPKPKHNVIGLLQAPRVIAPNVNRFVPSHSSVLHKPYRNSLHVDWSASPIANRQCASPFASLRFRPGKGFCAPQLIWAAVFVISGLLFSFTSAAAADVLQSGPNSVTQLTSGNLVLPGYWYLLMAALALLVPAGLILISVAGLEPQRAWDAALGSLAAISVTGIAYWAVGFGLQFGGVGLVYTRPELLLLVWEWSPFSPDWGVGWGMAGLSGWFLSGTGVSSLVYALFLAHLPWAMTAATLPVLALRGRAPATASAIVALLVGGILYPLAGNWVQGGGWLASLGSNVNLGHGLVDFGGAGTVYLLAGAFGLAALVVWPAPRRRNADFAEEMPPTQLPLLAAVGSLLLMAGTMGWLWANPLQTSTLSELGLMRGGVNVILYAAGGVLVPFLYTWFVTGRSDPTLTARGLAGGAVAGLAAGPFVQPGAAFIIGLIAGATTPFVMYLTNHVLRLEDRTGVLHMCAAPAIIGLFMVGLWADGVEGNGWQATGAGTYLGVPGQGVSGLLVANGLSVDFPGQLQAQVVGILALGLWGFLGGLIVCVPLSLLYYGLQRSAETGHQSLESELLSLTDEGEPFEDDFHDEQLVRQLAEPKADSPPGRRRPTGEPFFRRDS